MKKTTNYQLNQWAKSDRILMADFNADNAKIDAAIASRLGPAELIYENVYGKGGGEFSIDLTEMDWNKWSAVAMTLQPLSGYSDALVSFMVESQTPGAAFSALGSAPLQPTLMVLFPLRDASRAVHAVAFSGGKFIVTTGPYSSITKVSASINKVNGFAEGSRMQVYGIR